MSDCNTCKWAFRLILSDRLACMQGHSPTRKNCRLYSPIKAKEQTMSADSSETNRLLRNPDLMARAKKDFLEMLRRVSQESAAMAHRLEDGQLSATELHDTAVELEALADHLFRGSITLRGLSA